MRFLRMVISASLTLLVSPGSHADVLHLVDGSRLVGRIEQITDSEAQLSNTFAGDLKVPRKAIVSLETEAPVTLQLNDGAYLTGTLGVIETGTEAVAIQVEQVGSRNLALSEIKGIYRDDPQTLQRKLLAVQVTADANVGVTLNSGNTDSDNLHVDGNFVGRTLKNRYTLSAEYNQEKTDGIKTKENWASLIKYDHFVSEKWFWFNSANFEKDKFKDLDLRSAIAAGVGYQFFETDTRKLSLEVGPSYIDENNIVAEDDSFLGSRWAITYDQTVWNGLSFFHFQEGLLGLEDTSKLTIRSRTGFRMNVRDRIIARIQTAIDWNRSPSGDSKSTDYEHTLTIGYRF